MRLLGGLSPRAFLHRYWHKRALFVPQALPGFTGVVDQHVLAALAKRDDMESRIVERRGARWYTRQGPFPRLAVKPRNWTVLVSGVNHACLAADALLRRFAFVPQARMDDVMVSYATPGGGVGPHVDSYDVFLLQGPGRRRWRFAGRDLVLGPGDMLYLPPGVKHDGVAVDACTTYSIGFRAPRGAELGAAFLDWLHERGMPDARYRDPGLQPATHPGRLPEDMVRFAERVLGRIRWTRGDVAEFLGRYLSAPKPHVVFRRSRALGQVVRLHPKTQLLYRGRRFFLNGESFTTRHPERLRELADRRQASISRLAPVAKLIAEWRAAGYVYLSEARADG